MAIACTPTPVAATALQPQGGQDQKTASQAQTASQEGGLVFLALLQGVDIPAAPESALAEGTNLLTLTQAQSAQEQEAPALLEAAVPMPLEPPPLTALTPPGHSDMQDAALGVSISEMGVGDLLGQARFLEAQAGSALSAQMRPGVSWGQPTQGLMTASLGVQAPLVDVSAAGAAIANAAQAVALGAQSEQMQMALEQVQAELADSAPLIPSQEQAGDADLAPGRIALQGVQELSAAASQTLAPQVAQWVAQWLGTARTTSSGNPGSEATESYALAGLPGAGTARLTEQAVQAAQASADAQAGDTQAFEQARQEDLRFWLRGQQQRAEVVVQRDGQPVRVQVQIQGQDAHVVLRTDQEAMRTLLGEGMDQLREMLAQQGLQLAGIDVQSDAGRQERPPSSRAGWGAERQGSVQAAEGVAGRTLPGQQSTTAGPRGHLNVQTHNLKIRHIGFFATFGNLY